MFSAVMVNGGPRTFPPFFLAVFFQQGYLSQSFLVAGRIFWVGMPKVLSVNRSFIGVDFLLLFSLWVCLGEFILFNRFISVSGIGFKRLGGGL